MNDKIKVRDERVSRQQVCLSTITLWVYNLERYLLFTPLVVTFKTRRHASMRQALNTYSDRFMYLSAHGNWIMPVGIAGTALALMNWLMGHFLRPSFWVAPGLKAGPLSRCQSLPTACWLGFVVFLRFLRCGHWLLCISEHLCRMMYMRWHNALCSYRVGEGTDNSCSCRWQELRCSIIQP